MGVINSIYASIIMTLLFFGYLGIILATVILFKVGNSYE